MPPKRIENQARRQLVVDPDAWAWQVGLLENMVNDLPIGLGTSLFILIESNFQ